MRFFPRTRLPSFKTACAFCVTSIVLFAGWAVADASFGVFVSPQSYVVAGLGPDVEIRPAYFLWYPWFRVRIAVFSYLALVWLLGFGVIVYRMLRGTASDRSIRSLLIVVTLLCVTFGLAVGAKQLHAAGLRLRLAIAFDGFQQDVAVLDRAWPTESGSLPYSGAFKFYSWAPSILFVDSNVRRFQESAGGCIVRLDDGGYALELEGNPKLFVEHHPQDRRPTSFTVVTGAPPASNLKDSTMKFTLNKTVELKLGWFLTLYDFGQ